MSKLLAEFFLYWIISGMALGIPFSLFLNKRVKKPILGSEPALN